MPKIVDAQMREAAREFARLGFDQANINEIAEQTPDKGRMDDEVLRETERELDLEEQRLREQ